MSGKIRVSPVVYYFSIKVLLRKIGKQPVRPGFSPRPGFSRNQVLDYNMKLDFEDFPVDDPENRGLRALRFGQ
jgi:hypothetical protein